MIGHEPSALWVIRGTALGPRTVRHLLHFESGTGRGDRLILPGLNAECWETLREPQASKGPK